MPMLYGVQAPSVRKPALVALFSLGSVVTNIVLPSAKGLFSSRLDHVQTVYKEIILITRSVQSTRAVIAALENQRWASEGWKTVTIATKSAYVYNGMTQYMTKWKSQGWLTGAHPRSPRVGNADLWARAIGMVNEQGYYGCEVQLWLVSRDQNLQAEGHARWLAKESNLPVPEAYVPFVDPKSG